MGNVLICCEAPQALMEAKFFLEVFSMFWVHQFILKKLQGFSLNLKMLVTVEG